jgi:hypothetical protein
MDSAMQGVVLEKMAAAYETSNLLVQERLQAHSIFVHNRSKSKGALKYFNRYHGFPVMTRQEEELCLESVRNIQYSSSDRFKVVYAGPNGDPKAEPGQPDGNGAPSRPTFRTKGRQLKIF